MFSEAPASRIPSILASARSRFPGETPLHLVLDNYGTHKHPNGKAWMKKHSRFILHFVPTSSS